MRTFWVIVFIMILFLFTGCAAIPKGEEGARAPAAEAVDQPATQVAAQEPPWQYPIAPGVWYPGDGPLPAHPFKYYRVRCWPGCHDPNSQPRSHNY
jgi:hypothetical protein